MTGQRYYHPAIPSRGLDVGRCPDCGKKAFRSRSDAKRAARQFAQIGHLRAYKCGQWWHLTSQDAATTTRQRERA